MKLTIVANQKSFLEIMLVAVVATKTSNVDKTSWMFGLIAESATQLSRKAVINLSSQQISILREATNIGAGFKQA